MDTKQKIPPEMGDIFNSTLAQSNDIVIKNNLMTMTDMKSQLEAFEPPPNIIGDDIIINIDDEIKDPKALISVLAVMLFSAGNISVIGGKQKSRKTFFMVMLVVAFLSGQCGRLKGFPNEDAIVLMFDTEMGRSHVHKSLMRIYRMMNWKDRNDKLKVYYLREKSIEERIEIIKAQVERYHPQLVVIDGIVDLCVDFNSIEESAKTVQLLMELSSKYDCHITTVLHENKSGADGNLRGHLGTIISQKAETWIKLTPDASVTKVSAEATRNLPFDDFFFKVDEFGIPYTIEVDIPNKNEVQSNKIETAMKSILGVDALTYTKLTEELVERVPLGKSTAKTWISTALKCEFIIKGSDGLYRRT